MGMTYQFYCTPKGRVPKHHPSDNTKGWTPVGPELDREDFVYSLLSDSASKAKEPCIFSPKAFKQAIKTLKQLDRDVNAVLDMKNLDIGFRRRLIKGLVSAIYGYREYHYDYPKEYYPEKSWQRTKWPKDIWDKPRGSSWLQDVLKEVGKVAEGAVEIRLASF